MINIGSKLKRFVLLFTDLIDLILFFKENDFFIDNFNDDWCDWVEDDSQDCVCFFCQYKAKFDNVKQHMHEFHKFDFNQILSLQDFYHRIKIVNFIRKRLFTNQCYICDRKYSDPKSIENHLIESEHIFQLPTEDLFDFPEYYFSTIDDDCFLLFLDDFNDIS